MISEDALKELTCDCCKKKIGWRLRDMAPCDDLFFCDECREKISNEASLPINLQENLREW